MVNVGNVRPAAQRYSRYQVRPRCGTSLLPGGGLGRSVQRTTRVQVKAFFNVPAQLRRGFATLDAKLTCTRPGSTTRCSRCQSGSWPSRLCLQPPRSGAGFSLSLQCTRLQSAWRSLCERVSSCKGKVSPTTGTSFPALSRMGGRNVHRMIVVAATSSSTSRVHTGAVESESGFAESSSTTSF